MRVLFPAGGLGVVLGVLFLACGGDDGTAPAATSADASVGNAAADAAATGDAASDDPADAGAEASEAGPAKVTITLSTDGDGAGTVELDPPGGVYDVGTKLTLSPTATTGTFIGWTGVACDPPAEAIAYEEVCHVTVTTSTIPTAVFGARTLTGSVDLAMSDFSITETLASGTKYVCSFRGFSDTTTVTVDLALLANATVMGKMRTDSSLSYLRNESPPICDSTFVTDEASLPAPFSADGANVHVTASTFPSEATTTLTGVLAGSGTGATITGDVSLSYMPLVNGTAPSTGTGHIVLSAAP